ncbi:Uncharacterised protein [Streptomyces griseus]|nr:Uncharacterised protein [Streptomyces griseus]
MRAPELGEPAVQTGVDVEADDVAALAQLAGPSPVEGQFQLLGQSGQGLLPVVELAGQGAVRVVLVAQLRLLPQGVVGVLDRHRRKGRRLTGGAGRVGEAEVAGEGGQREAVGDDVVQDDQQDVVLGSEDQQPGAYGEPFGQVEALGDHLGDGRVHRGGVGGRLGEDHLRSGLGRREDVLARRPVRLGERRPQALVAGEDVLERRGERGAVQAAGQPERETHVVRAAGSLEPVHQPEALLGEGEREHGGAVERLQDAPVGGGAGEAAGEGGDGGGLEDGTDGEFRPEGLADPAEQPDRGEGVAAEGEEVVVDTDPSDREHLGDQGAEPLLAGGPRGPVGRGGLRGGGVPGVRRGDPADGRAGDDGVQPVVRSGAGQGGEEAGERLAVPGHRLLGVEVGVGVEVEEEARVGRPVVDDQGEVFLGPDGEAAHGRGVPGEGEPLAVHEEVDLGAPQPLAVADAAEVAVDVLVAVALVPQRPVDLLAH